MVATTDCVEKSKPIVGNRVSKPLMEKKRRARINKCLDQLKSLLENYYSSSIRKRKLEKADILELTVKHLRNLQKIQSCTAAASEFSDYQTGFRRCMANVNQYLLLADNLNGSDGWMLSQLSSKLCRSRGREEGISTMDSSRGQAAETQDEVLVLLPSAAGPGERKTAKSKTLKPLSASTSNCLPSKGARQSSTSKQTVPVAAPTQSRPPREEGLTNKNSNRDEVAKPQHNVWRPW